MSTVFDYLKWRGDLPFELIPLCEADALIFCELAYIFFDGIVPESTADGKITVAKAAETFFERNANREIRLGEIVPNEIVDLFRLASISPRYAEVEMSGFVNIVDDQAVEQFSAVTFYPADGQIFVAYRGTDDSITGWREDFRMAFLTPVPAQKRAQAYLFDVARENDSKIFIGGHSKGGNLAIWAALNADEDISERIERIFNFDGPGFLCDVWESAEYHKITGKLSTVIPTGSVVGLLLKYDSNYRVTRSTAKNYLYQHDALTWEVSGGSFVCDDDVAPEIKRINDMVGRWIDSMAPETRENFVEGFFDILCSTNAKTVTDLAANRSAVLKAFSNIDPETKQALLAGVKFFVGEGRSSVAEQIRLLIKKRSHADDDNEAQADDTVDSVSEIIDTISTPKAAPEAAPETPQNAPLKLRHTSPKPTQGKKTTASKKAAPTAAKKSVHTRIGASAARKIGKKVKRAAKKYVVRMIKK